MWDSAIIPKARPIVIVDCLLNALIECHMKELRRRGISCTCLSRDDGDKDGALAGKLYTLYTRCTRCTRCTRADPVLNENADRM